MPVIEEDLDSSEREGEEDDEGDGDADVEVLPDPGQLLEVVELLELLLGPHIGSLLHPQAMVVQSGEFTGIL